MHELISMLERIGAKFQQLFKGLKLSKSSDIWTINKTYNQLLALELKKRFNLLNFARKLF
jgi:hypothetical protein